MSTAAAPDAPVPLDVVVMGASGDLAKKKVYPSLFTLFQTGYLPPASTAIYGYARSAMTDDEFRRKISANLKVLDGVDDGALGRFLAMCHYVRGQYDDPAALKALSGRMAASHCRTGTGEAAAASGSNRMFYYAIPPSQFAPVSQAIVESGIDEAPGDGWSRVVVEKPFGHDLPSFELLDDTLSRCFSEQKLYRIDHYLGKEMVQNLMILRFANAVLEPLWNRDHISNVQITFKEDFGTEGRGGYFDGIGIVRDVMQNHLLQMLSLVAMEPPVRVSGEDYSNYVRDEKVKVLRAVRPLALGETVLGQYVGDEAGVHPG